MILLNSLISSSTYTVEPLKFSTQSDYLQIEIVSLVNTNSNSNKNTVKIREKPPKKTSESILFKVI